MIRALLVLLALASVAGADPLPAKRIVGILEVRGPSPEAAAAFESDLEQQVASQHYWIATRAKMRERLRSSTKWAEGCTSGPCLAEVRVQTRADVVLLAALTGSATTFGYVVTLVRTDNGTVLSQAAERCDVCTQNEAQSAATLAAIKLLNDLPAELPDPQGAHARETAAAVSRLEAQLAAQSARTRKLGIALTVVGLVAVGIGTVLYVTDDDKSKATLGMAAAGGGMLGSGVLVLSF